MGRCLFITGTDTGVGKTLLTCLLLQYLREEGIHSLAMKPFCSGGREDVERLRSVMDGELTPDEINPWFFPEPVAPVASFKKYPSLNLETVIERIETLKKSCDILLIEGAGGLCVPLTNTMKVLDVIRSLSCDVVLVSANRLGTINHTLLSAKALLDAGIPRLKIVLMDQQSPDESSEANEKIIQEFLPDSEVIKIGFLGALVVGKERVKSASKKIKKTLARVRNFDSFSPSSLQSGS